MVYRVYVAKKSEYAIESSALCAELKELLKIQGLESLRIYNRYDVEAEKEIFEKSVKTVFSEPQLDEVFFELPNGDVVFAVEYLPGQFDQRADSAAQCIQLMSAGERPMVKSAKVYVLTGRLSLDEVEAVKKFVINPVESREAELKEQTTLKMNFTAPKEVETLSGFNAKSESALNEFIVKRGLAMDLADIKFLQNYFISENREPTITEIKMIDTYWSDHCRHTTFLTTITDVKFEDEEVQKAYIDYLEIRKKLGRTKPINLMDLATIAARSHKAEGKLENLDESEEINACTVKIKVQTDGGKEDWLLLFKNETHNHPTEIEPFGGAATCIGGAIRDPLSGRAYVYSAMRVTGAGNPLVPIENTVKGKLPQRKIVVTSANGYSSYGNQIGLATGLVDEIYHEGYVAKRMEIGAVIGAVKADCVVREVPQNGDIVILLGGRTGRDGCGGATGSSKSHNLSSLENCGAEVQKGNAPEERKLQRLFRNADATKMIKRCNDFGAGGVSVAIGELADGLLINLDKVPKKYEGLDGTELAISESQERMAVVVDKKDAKKFIALAEAENLEATAVATVTGDNRLKMTWNGKTIVDISRDFLNSNGAEKKIKVAVKKQGHCKEVVPNSVKQGFLDLMSNINICSKRGLSERFDSTIGAGTVLMPYGGKYQSTPIQAMINKVNMEQGDTTTCSYMAYGYNPKLSESGPFYGGYYAVVESISKLIAAGAEFNDVYLTFQEYFEKPNKDEEKWGKPFAALLGAYKAQRSFGISAIGGKDSMSGSFENLSVPPTLVSFAVTTGDYHMAVSPEFKKSESPVYLFESKKTENGLIDEKSLITTFNTLNALNNKGKILANYTITAGGIAEAISKMCFGNMYGFEFCETISNEKLFELNYGSFVVETKEEIDVENAVLLGRTTDSQSIVANGESIELHELFDKWTKKLETVFPVEVKTEKIIVPTLDYSAISRYSCGISVTRPKVLIPVFPGTNCEYDTKKSFERAGAEVELFVIKNITDVKPSVKSFAKSVQNSQIVFISGGFSGGDEPDGSGKFITAFFRNDEIRRAIEDLMDKREGLMGGICNGFQALIKMGLVPFGKIIDTDENCPTLSFNTIGRHQSRLVRTRVVSNKSPWFSLTEVGEIYTVPISHGEGRFLAKEQTLETLVRNGQITTQYVNSEGRATMDIDFNPNGSVLAIEGITSPDGRIFGKMGHSERIGKGLYQNVSGEYDSRLFEAAVKFFE